MNILMTLVTLLQACLLWPWQMLNPSGLPEECNHLVRFTALHIVTTQAVPLSQAFEFFPLLSAMGIGHFAST